jgi:hypothetical protein
MSHISPPDDFFLTQQRNAIAKEVLANPNANIDTMDDAERRIVDPVTEHRLAILIHRIVVVRNGDDSAVIDQFEVIQQPVRPVTTTTAIAKDVMAAIARHLHVAPGQQWSLRYTGDMETPINGPFRRHVHAGQVLVVSFV